MFLDSYIKKREILIETACAEQVLRTWALHPEVLWGEPLSYDAGAVVFDYRPEPFNAALACVYRHRVQSVGDATQRIEGVLSGGLAGTPRQNLTAIITDGKVVQVILTITTDGKPPQAPFRVSVSWLEDRNLSVRFSGPLWRRRVITALGGSHYERWLLGAATQCELGCLYMMRLLPPAVIAQGLAVKQ